MGAESKIEWTDATWNPWRGCSKVSPGCAHCYMFRDQRRYGRDPEVVVRAADPTFYAPLRSRKWRDLPEGALVFTCSWSDWFHEAADEWREEAWTIIANRPDLRWQILTKRPERILECLPADWGKGWPNVWLGVSIENWRFTHRAALLREVPAAVRFVSAEPLLGPLVPICAECGGTGISDEHNAVCICVMEEPEWRERRLELDGIDWIIVGGESGPGHRRIDPRWVRSLRWAAEATDTAFFFKQWGGPRPESGGRELDGRTWDEMPDLRTDPPTIARSVQLTGGRRAA